MTSVKVVRATDWSQVEKAAAITKRCIEPEKEESLAGRNWDKAKETWDTLGGNVVYFIISQELYPHNVLGYMRLFNTTPRAYSNNPTWVIDYMWPLSAEAVVLVADILPGNVLVKSFFANGDLLTRRWPKVALSLAVPEAPYRVTTEKVAEWLIVVP